MGKGVFLLRTSEVIQERRPVLDFIIPCLFPVLASAQSRSWKEAVNKGNVLGEASAPLKAQWGDCPPLPC